VGGATPGGGPGTTEKGGIAFRELTGAGLRRRKASPQKKDKKEAKISGRG